LASHLRFSFLFVLAASLLVVVLSFACSFITCCLLCVSPLAAYCFIACYFRLHHLPLPDSSFCHLLFFLFLALPLAISRFPASSLVVCYFIVGYFKVCCVLLCHLLLQHLLLHHCHYF
jgi:hypothetical protein